MCVIAIGEKYVVRKSVYVANMYVENCMLLCVCMINTISCTILIFPRVCFIRENVCVSQTKICMCVRVLCCKRVR